MTNKEQQIELEKNYNNLKQVELKNSLKELIDAKVELEKLSDFVNNNKLPFCIQRSIELPFKANYHSSVLLIDLITMINDGKLILNK